MGFGVMQVLHALPKDDLPVAAPDKQSSWLRVVAHWVVGIVVAFGLGTWLVWWSASVQRTFALEEIRSSCQRIMPETVDRCVDTVVIQRGGARQ